MIEEIMDFILDIWGFFKERKKYWLIPLVLTLIIVGGLIIFTQTSALAPFIYTLF